MPSEDVSAAPPAARAFARWTFRLLAVASAGFLAFPFVAGRVTSLFPAALPASPYWVAQHAPLLYLAFPLTLLGTVALLLAPGVLLMIGRARTCRLEDAVGRGFFAAFAIDSVLALAVARVFPQRALAFEAAVLLAAWGAWIVCVRRGAAVTQPRDASRRVAWAAGALVAGTIALLPIVCWQDLNPDGLELLTFGRSLDAHVIPRLPNGAMSGLGLGMVAAAYPAHWFSTLLGLTETAARAPMLMWIPLLVIGIIGAAESERRLTAIDEGLLTAGALVFVAALSYNATYHPYSSDMASPASIDVLAAVCLTGMCRAYRHDERGWFLAFALLGYFARPVPLLLCGLLAVAHVLAGRRPISRGLLTLVLAVSACVIAALCYERLLAPLLGVSLEEPSSGVMGRRLRWLVFADWRRALAAAVLAGLAPVLSLVRAPRALPPDRVFALAAVFYFGFFWFPAFYALHHFVPVAVLLMVVHWAQMAGASHRSLWRTASALGIAGALLLALPRAFAVDRSSRALATQLEWRVGAYREGFEGWRQAFEAKHLLESLFPNFETVDDPARTWTAPAWVLVHYAATDPGDPASANYLVLPKAESAPDGWTLVARDDSGSVWVRDRDRWQATLSAPPATGFRSASLAVPREALLPLWGVPAGRYDLDLAQIRRRLLGD